jgi:hypothetical protein
MCVYNRAIDLFLSDVTSLSCPWCNANMHPETDGALNDLFQEVQDNIGHPP